MMRTFESSIGSRRKGTSASLYALVFLVAFFCIFGSVIRPYASHIAIPTLGLAAKGGRSFGSGLSVVASYFRTQHSLTAENAALKAQVLAMQQVSVDRAALLSENLKLKADFGRKTHTDALLATVLVGPGEAPYDSLTLDVGSADGVVVGNPVAANGNLLIGAISDVYPHTARVKLYSAPGTSYEGFLRGDVPIRVEGQGGGALRAEVPYDAHATAGDTVTLPALASNIAFVIEHVDAGQGDSAVTAYIRLPVSPFGLRFVEVWKGITAQ